MIALLNYKNLLLFGLCLFVNNSFALNITSQNTIDNFNILYPDSTNIEELSIIGLDIDNLEGLSQLVSIKKSLRIIGTRIQNCFGLNNVESIGSLELRDNLNLILIDDLSSLEFSSNFIISSIIITGNLELENCTLQNMCDLVQNYHLVDISNNSEFCKNILATHIDCEVTPDSLHTNIIFQDDFDNWNPNNTNWTISPGSQYQILYSEDSLANKLALHEGIFSIKIDQFAEDLDVSFDLNYSAYGTAFFLSKERNETTSEESIIYRFSFNSIKDSINYKIYIDNLQPSQDNNKITELFLFVIPYIEIFPAGVGPPLLGKFVIDDFKISSTTFSPTFSPSIHLDFNVFPNPTSQFLNINNFNEGELIILDVNGQLISKKKIKNNSNYQQDVSSFKNGIYFMVFKEMNTKEVRTEVLLKK